MNTSIQRIGLFTILRKESVRIFRIWKQTILPSAITQSLYFLIFGGFIGERIGNVDGLSYVAFLVPGLIMMSVITNSFSNTASSFFGAKFQRNIDEMLVSPLKPYIILAGYVGGGIVRGLVVGLVVFLVSLIFAPLQIVNIAALLYFLFITAAFFSLLGFFNGMFAKKFDDVSIIPTFVLTPLTYLGGVFYSLDYLPPFWRSVSFFNPIVYMIDGFRYGFSGFATTPVLASGLILLAITSIMTLGLMYMIRKGIGLKS